MRPIKILNITSTRYGVGGVERLLLDMSHKYTATEFEVSYCNLFCENNGGGVFPTEIKRRGLTYFDIPGKRVWHIPQMLFRLARLLRTEKFDVVHLHMAKATMLGFLASRFCNQRLLITRHYTYKLVAKYPAPIRFIEKIATKYADYIISISEYVKNDLVSAGIDAAKITVIHNGIDLGFLDNVRTVKKVESPPDLLIGTVGSLTRRKGHKYLIEAFARAVKQHPGLRLQIFGEGPERTFLEELTKSLGLETNIVFKGFVQNIPAALQYIDIYVHPAVDEPFGIAVLEAMASGRPVIATAVDGVTEIVLDGVTGFLVAPRDVGELSQTILRVIAELPRMNALTARARKDVEKRFDIKQTVRAYEAVYSELCR